MSTKPIKKERQNRTVDESDVRFHHYTVTPETAHTAILLLDSHEPEILCQTLRSISTFASQSVEHCHLLYGLGILPRLIQNTDWTELNLQRFVLKLLALICQLPESLEEVLKNETVVPKLLALVTKTEDVFVLEFALQNLSLLTKELKGCEQIMTQDVTRPLFSRLEHDDPDVQKNSLQIISNLIDDPVSVELIVNNSVFAWSPILDLLTSKYVALQKLAIHTIDKLICRVKDTKVQETFRASPGIENLFLILESSEWQNVHVDVLELLRNFVETEDNIAHFHKLGCELNLQSFLQTCLDVEKPSCLAVLTRMSKNLTGREVLYDTNSDVLFCNLLLGSNVALYGDAAYAVANMCELKASAARMVETNVVEALTVLLGDETLPWLDVRLNCIKALGNIGKTSMEAVKLIMESKVFSTLRAIVLKGCTVPMEILHFIMSTYMALQQYYACEEKMVDKAFMKELLLLLSCNDIRLKTLVCETLCGLMVNIKAQICFNAALAEPALADLLQIDHYGLRTAVCQLITLSVNKAGALKYLDMGTVHYMINSKDIRMKCPAWETAIEAILKNHLSAKFAYFGRLEINDRTMDGFYVTRRLQPTFLTLERLHSNVTSPLSLIYVCNFDTAKEELHSTSVDDHSPGTASSSRVKGHGQRKASISNVSLHGKSQSLPDVLPPDPYLKQYLERLRKCFCNHFSSERDRVASCIGAVAKVLAEFVQTQMCGLTIQRNCNSSSVELHVNELKLALSSSIIPLGYVRVGGHLERSLLFKAMADQIGIPCALVRGTFGRCWCEVALPDGMMHSSINVEYYPSYLLRPNYVVDLMDTPVRFLAIGSAEAAMYCDLPRSLPYVTIPKPLGERCLCAEDMYKVNVTDEETVSKEDPSVQNVTTKS